MLHKIIYEVEPVYRLTEQSILEKYEGGKWLSESESKLREELIKGMGNEVYENYIIDIKNRLSRGEVPVWRRMRLWARIVKRAHFELIGLVLIFLDIFHILPSPISIIVGSIISAISICLAFFEETKPLFK